MILIACYLLRIFSEGQFGFQKFLHRKLSKTKASGNILDRKGETGKPTAWRQWAFLPIYYEKNKIYYDGIVSNLYGR